MRYHGHTLVSSGQGALVHRMCCSTSWMQLRAGVRPVSSEALRAKPQFQTPSELCCSNFYRDGTGRSGEAHRVGEHIGLPE